MKISFIIPTFNSENGLEKTLQSITESAHGYAYEVIIVDHGSSDTTGQIAQIFKTQFIPNPKSTIASSRNLGAKIAKGELLAFIDSDVVIEKDWVKKSLNLIAQYAPDLLQGRLIPSREKGLASKYRYVSRKIQTFGTFNLLSNMVLNPDGATINTAAFICKRSSYLVVHGMNEELIGYEGFDLYQKFLRQNFKLLPTLSTTATVYWNKNSLTLFRYIRYMTKKGSDLALLHHKLNLFEAYKGLFFLNLKSYPWHLKPIRFIIAYGTIGSYFLKSFQMAGLKIKGLWLRTIAIPFLICFFSLLQVLLPREFFPFSHSHFYTHMESFPKVVATLSSSEREIDAFKLLPVGPGYTLHEMLMYQSKTSKDSIWAQKTLSELIPLQYKSPGSKLEICYEKWNHYSWKLTKSPDQRDCFYEKRY